MTVISAVEVSVQQSTLKQCSKVFVIVDYVNIFNIFLIILVTFFTSFVM